MEFNERLINYRISLGINTQAEFAEKIGIKRNLLNMLESGSRKPSDNVLSKLVEFSGKGQEYWLFGIDKENYLEEREEFKNLKDVVKSLSEIGMVEEGKEFSEAVKEVILAAAIADVKHLLYKSKLK